MDIFYRKRLMKRSSYGVVLFLSALFLISCAELQSGVTTLSEKVKETFHVREKSTVTAGMLNLRKDPSTQSLAISVLRKGEELEVFQLSGKWAKVKASDGKEGWVYARYITGFEALFAEEPRTSEAQKSTSRPDTQQGISPGGVTLEKQEVDSGDKTDRDTQEVQRTAGSVTEVSALSPQKQSGVDVSPDDRDAAGQTGPAAEIETPENATLPGPKPPEEIEGETTSIQRNERPIDENGQFVFSQPEGLFSLNLPVGWDHRKESQDDFEKYVFENSTQATAVWVVHTSSEDYDADEFYRDLASLLMERSGSPSEISPSTLRKDDSGLEWVYGKVEIKSETLEIYEFWIKAQGGLLWALVEVYPQSVTETDLESLSAIRCSFSFDTELNSKQ